MGKRKKKRKLKKLLETRIKIKCWTCLEPFECDFCEQRFCVRVDGKCAFTGMMYNLMFDGIEGRVCQQCFDDGIRGTPMQRWYSKEGKQITKSQWEAEYGRKSP